MSCKKKEGNRNRNRVKIKLTGDTDCKSYKIVTVFDPVLLILNTSAYLILRCIICELFFALPHSPS